MASVAQSLFRFLRGSNGSGTGTAKAAARTPGLRRRSSGLAELLRCISEKENLCILDLGPTSPGNIAHLTGLGHKVYNEDVLHASTQSALTIRPEDGQQVPDVPRFLRENLRYDRNLFDAVLCWDVPDYMPEALVKPSVERIHTVMKPGGVLLAYFHTREAGPEAPHYRYHIAGNDVLELQPGPRFRLQRAFNNRHIENLFRDFASIKFFLARDHVREVLVVR